MNSREYDTPGGEGSGREYARENSHLDDDTRIMGAGSRDVFSLALRSAFKRLLAEAQAAGKALQATRDAGAQEEVVLDKERVEKELQSLKAKLAEVQQTKVIAENRLKEGEEQLAREREQHKVSEADEKAAPDARDEEITRLRGQLNEALAIIQAIEDAYLGKET